MSSSTPKIQPWKAMKSLEEDPNPNISEKPVDAQALEPSSIGGGAAVSKPTIRTGIAKPSTANGSSHAEEGP